MMEILTAIGMIVAVLLGLAVLGFVAIIMVLIGGLIVHGLVEWIGGMRWGPPIMLVLLCIGFGAMIVGAGL